VLGSTGILHVGDDIWTAVAVEICQGQGVDRVLVHPSHVGGPGTGEGAAIVLPDTDSLVRVTRSQVQVAIVVQIGQAQGVGGIGGVPNHLVGAPQTGEWCTVVPPGTDHGAGVTGDDVAPPIVVQVAHGQGQNAGRTTNVVGRPAAGKGGAIVAPGHDFEGCPAATAADQVQIPIVVQVGQRQGIDVVAGPHRL